MLKQTNVAASSWVTGAPRVTVVVWAVIVAGMVGVAGSVEQMRVQGVDPRWPLLAGLTIVGAVAMLKLRAAPVSFSIADTFTLTTLFLLGPAPATVTAALEALTISVLLSPTQRRPTRVLFNIGAVAAAMCVAGGVLDRLAGGELTALLAHSPVTAAVPVLCAVSTYFILNTGVVSAAVAIEQHTEWRAVWRTHFAHCAYCRRSISRSPSTWWK